MMRRSSFFQAILPSLAAFAMLGCRPALPPPTPLAQLDAAQTHGHQVFETRCAACHYDRREGALHGPSLLGVFKKPTLASGAAATDERVTATIVHGRNMMPALGNQLDSGELDDLLQYLNTL